MASWKKPTGRCVGWGIGLLVVSCRGQGTGNDAATQGAAISSNATIEEIVLKISRWQHEHCRVRGVDGLEHSKEAAASPPSRLSLPFVTLTFAQTLDGMIAARSRTSSGSSSSSNLRLSGPESLVMTHALRSMHDAVLVGGGTFFTDNPRLSNRLWRTTDDTHQPRPVVLDTNLRHLKRRCSALMEERDSGIGSIIRAQNPIFCCTKEAAASWDTWLRNQCSERHQQQRLQVCQSEETSNKTNQLLTSILSSIELLACLSVESVTAENTSNPEDNYYGAGKQPSKGLDLVNVLLRLRRVHGIQSVMVEGGASVLSSFLGTFSLVHCLCVTIAPSILGAVQGLPAFPTFPKTPANGDSSETLLHFSEGWFERLGSDCVYLARTMRGSLSPSPSP